MTPPTRSDQRQTKTDALARERQNRLPTNAKQQLKCTIVDIFVSNVGTGH